MSRSNTTTGLGPAVWRRFTVLASIEFLTVMDASVVNIALPTIRRDLSLSDGDTAWIVATYLIFFAGFLLLSGRLSDLVGRRRQFILGTVTFTLASAVCGVSTAQAPLLIGRACQGLGAAMTMPAALALITDLFPEGAGRNRALGIFSGMAGVAAPVGLVFGGLVTGIDWHLIFWINVPLGLAVALIGPRALPPSTPGSGSVDLIAATAATATLMLLTFALVRLGTSGWARTDVVLPLVAAVLLGAVFVGRQTRSTHPLIPPALLRRRTVLVGTLVFSIVGTILLATFFLVTMYLQRVRLLAPTASAAAYLPVPLAMLTGTLLAPWAVGRQGPKTVLAGGLALQAASLAAWALTSSADGPLALDFEIPAIAWALGLGLAIVSSFVVCTSHLDPELAGTASGLATSSYQGGGAVGLSLVVVIAQAVSNHSLTAGLPPTDATLTGHRTALWILAALACSGAVIAGSFLPRARSAAATDSH